MAAAADGGTDSKAQNGKANGRLKGHHSGPEFEVGVCRYSSACANLCPCDGC
jgi:hypothetical protein